MTNNDILGNIVLEILTFRIFIKKDFKICL